MTYAYTVESAQAVAGSVFIPRVRFFLGQCVDLNSTVEEFVVASFGPDDPLVQVGRVQHVPRL